MTIRQTLLFGKVWLTNCDNKTNVIQQGKVRLPVGPRDTEELVPPASDDHRNVEAKNERERDETGERLAIQGDPLKHPTTQLYHIYNNIIINIIIKIIGFLFYF